MQHFHQIRKEKSCVVAHRLNSRIAEVWPRQAAHLEKKVSNDSGSRSTPADAEAGKAATFMCDLCYLRLGTQRRLSRRHCTAAHACRIFQAPQVGNSLVKHVFGRVGSYWKTEKWSTEYNEHGSPVCILLQCPSFLSVFKHGQFLYTYEAFSFDLGSLPCNTAVQ